MTPLSPYIRHGVLSLAEVRDAVFGWLRQRLWHQLGNGIWHDLEPLRTGHPAAAYAPELSADIAEGRTGLACIDAFAAELTTRGWQHNHARMWLASCFSSKLCIFNRAHLERYVGDRHCAACPEAAGGCPIQQPQRREPGRTPFGGASGSRSGSPLPSRWAIALS